MFGKLVKHEFRATARIIPFVFLVTIFLALVHVLTGRLNLGALSKISLVLTVLMCFAQIPITFALLIWRYYKNMYSNEAYLTQTLPVPPSQLLWSKLLVGYVWAAASYLVAAAVGFGVAAADLFKTSAEFRDFRGEFHQLLTFVGLEDHQAVMIFILLVLFSISIVTLLAEAYFAITVGSSSRMHGLGIGGPILIFFAEYIVLQVVNTAAVLFIPLGLQIMSVNGELTQFRLVSQTMFSQVMDSLNNSGTTSAGIETGIVGMGSMILLPFILAAMLIITSRFIARHTNIK